MGTEKEPSPRRFFVRVFAEEPDELVKLRDSGLDLFPGVKRPGDAFPRSVDGLLAVDEIVGLVDEGFQVLVEATMEARSYAGPVEVDVKAWKQAVLRQARHGGP
jgi:hypothetical protein